jgi:hypothetical protein
MPLCTATGTAKAAKPRYVDFGNGRAVPRLYACRPA